MAVTEITSISKNSTDGLRYLFYGTYFKTSTVNGKAHLDQPHPNKNGVKKRNELISGVGCRISYKGAVKDFDYYNKQKPNRKNQAIMITMSFSKNDFDFFNKEDVYRATKIGRNFVKRAYPHRLAIIAAQHDNINGTPHLHIFVSNFRTDNLRAFNKNQTNIYRLRHVADRIVHGYNLRNPEHQITEMTTYRKKQHHHQRTPTPAEMDVLRRLKKALALNPTSQASLRRVCRKYGLTASFKRGRKRSGGRRKRGRRRSRRGLVFKSAKSNGFIKASQLQWFGKYCPEIEKLHNYRERRTLFKTNWTKYQTAKRNEIKEIARKMDKSGIFDNLYKVGSVDGLDEYKWEARHNAGVIVSLKNYTKRNGNFGQSIRYRLAGHSHYYSGYQFIKAFGQNGRKFNNWDVQNQIGKNHEAIINFEDRNSGDFESTFNSINTTGRRDLDTQLSVQPTITQPARQSSSDNEPVPTLTNTDNDTAKKRKAIHDYYRTAKSDRDRIDKFFAKLDRFLKRNARAVELAMVHYRKRTSAWLKKNAIRPLEYKVLNHRTHQHNVNKLTKLMNKLSLSGQNSLIHSDLGNFKLYVDGDFSKSDLKDQSRIDHDANGGGIAITQSDKHILNQFFEYLDKSKLPRSSKNQLLDNYAEQAKPIYKDNLAKAERQRQQAKVQDKQQAKVHQDEEQKFDKENVKTADRINGRFEHDQNVKTDKQSEKYIEKEKKKSGQEK